MKQLKIMTRNSICLAITSKGFLISLLTGILLCVSQYFQEVYSVSEYLYIYKKNWPSMLVPHTVFTKWIGGESYSFQYFAFFILIPLLATLPAGATIASDFKSKYINNLLTRSNREYYFISKIIAAFFVGGVVTIIPLLINLYLTAITLPSILPNNATGFFAIRNGYVGADIFYSNPYLYIFMFVVFIYFFSGMVAACATSLGINGIKPFVIVIYPFLVSLTLYSILGELHLYSWIPFCFLNPAQLYILKPFPVICEMVIMQIIIIGEYFKGKKLDVL